MKILHVIPSVASRYGGPSVAVRGYCAGLLRAGHQPTIATTNADGQGCLDVPVGAATDDHGIETWFFPRHGEAFKFSPKLADWLKRSGARYDLVHVHAVFSHSSLAAGRACRLHGVPYIVRPLGSLDPWSLEQQAWKKRLLLWSAVGAFLERAAALHFTTADEQRLAEPVTGTTRGVVVPLGVDDAFLAVPPIPPTDRERRVIVLTRLHPKKNLESLIEAFHTCKAEGVAQWKLLIAGSGDVAYELRLRRLAADGAAASRIEFQPWVDGSQKRELLRQSAVCAVPSHQENFGLSLLEALACGVPALTSSGVNLAPDIRKHEAGWVTGPGAPALAAALTQAIEDTSDRARRSAKARLLAEQFTWARATEQLIYLYESVAHRGVSSGARA